MLIRLISELNSLQNQKKAQNLQKYFKTRKGQYGQGDIFLGIPVPEQRKIVKKYLDLKLDEIQQLLNSKIHEQRLIGLLILTNKYNQSENKQEIFNFYLKNTANINNWDLVDLSAPNIIGSFLINKPKQQLYQLASSENLWEKRIAVISTFYFIKNNQFEDSLKIAEILLNDSHDLIHKAVGWMLREIGKRNQEIEEQFLKKHHKIMPRTMLRYAIEKFDKDLKQKYLRGEI